MDSGEAPRPETPHMGPTADAPVIERVGSSRSAGEFVTLDGETYYRITAYHKLAPFMMSLASDSDLWMFVTSGGGMTAGRVDASGALFPYQTVDRLHNAHHYCGPLSLVRVEREDGSTVLWRPLYGTTVTTAATERYLYKNVIGNRLIFEEINRDLGLAFRSRWCGSDLHGWVRTVTLENIGSREIRISLMDGFRNVLPFGAPIGLYQTSSVLVDAYRKAEVDPGSRMGIYSLTAGITDRAEAAEVLRANTVWCHGLDDYRVHLSDEAVNAFRTGRTPAADALLNGRRSHYLVSSDFELPAGDRKSWHMAADVGLDHVKVAALRRRILDTENLYWEVEAHLKQADEALERNVASADGLQLTADTEASVHHFANVLFNNMRGGVFAENHNVPTADLIDFITDRNRTVATRCRAFLEALPDRIRISELLAESSGTGDADLQRLCHEYLPIYFGRRHGDPSRPWNMFSIKVRHGDGRRALKYEGNWRDIFQNWEALCTVFPDFLPGVVAKFVNASTVDGFNPYRITREGVDWETIDPDNPWTNIGYWGDHQIVYLLKLLEAMAHTAPGALQSLLDREIFSYAQVPYRIKPYARILEDPHETIDYDSRLAARIEQQVRELGTDGKLLKDPDGAVRHVNLLEKLLVPLLSKLSNLVVDGGIWMNTQRPEWNDANNALVGNGVSVVTLCYLRRYVVFLMKLLEGRPDADVSVSTEIADWFDGVRDVLADGRGLLDLETIPDTERKRMLDGLSGVFSDYRATVYDNGLGGRRGVGLGKIRDFCGTALAYLDRGVRANRREDGLYHAYMLLDLSDDGQAASLHGLQEMLEGQVAVLSSGLLDPAEAVDILDRLFESPLYRPERRSFMLYPEKTLPGFLAKNSVDESEARAIPLLNDLLDAGDPSILAVDAAGVGRFNGDFRNADDVGAAMDRLGDVPDADRAAVLELFETTFGHNSYTGRSGAMYAYEGLGSVYWHMVAKLLLAVQETCLRAERDGAPEDLWRRLAALYYRIRSGLGFEKPVGQYGAFPTDPYSHTPPSGGAKQPGMTGQVKEEILTRFGELGIRVREGRLSFRPVLLRAREFLGTPAVFDYYDLDGEARTLDLGAGMLAFTYCQTPIVYERVPGAACLRVDFKDGSTRLSEGCALDASTSRSLLSRDGRIGRIHVGVPEDVLLKS